MKHKTNYDKDREKKLRKSLSLLVFLSALLPHLSHKEEKEVEEYNIRIF